jgi:hypothetical protein
LNEAELEPLWELLREQGDVEESATLIDFLHADQTLATTGTRTLEEIAESVQAPAQQAEPESDDEMVEVAIQPPEPVSRQAAYKGFDQLRKYVEENAKDPQLIQMCHKFEDFFEQERVKNSVQAPITQFLPTKQPTQPTITQFFI